MIGDVGIVGVWTYINTHLGHWVAIQVDATHDGTLVHTVVGVIEPPSIILKYCLIVVGTANHALLVFL